MHWAHYRTDDIISWELLPCAMAPVKVYDAGGYFSVRRWRQRKVMC